MLRKKEVLNELISLTDTIRGHETVNGHGPLVEEIYKFDKVKLYAMAPKIATYLSEIGLADLQTGNMISLASFSKDKKGNTWNSLETPEDYDILSILIAASEAAGFITYDEETVNKNIEGYTKNNKLVRPSEIKFLSNPDSKNVLGEKWMKFVNNLLTEFKTPVKANLINIYSALAENGETFILNPDYSIKRFNTANRGRFYR